MLIALSPCKIGTSRVPFAPLSMEHHLTVKNLQPNTQYYRKVIAHEAGDVRSQGSVQMLGTIGQQDASGKERPK